MRNCSRSTSSLKSVSYTHLDVYKRQIIIATGSEVELALKAQAELKQKGQDVRVVSMPSMELFDQQSDEYKESVLPKDVRKRLGVEMGTDFGWYKYCLLYTSRCV